jgi:hypothetical protein
MRESPVSSNLARDHIKASGPPAEFPVQDYEGATSPEAFMRMSEIIFLMYILLCAAASLMYSYIFVLRLNHTIPAAHSLFLLADSKNVTANIKSKRFAIK